MSDVAFDVLEESVGSPETAAEQSVARIIGEVLHKHYPPPKGIGFWWAVRADARGGIVHIWNLALSATHGYTLLLERFAAPGNDKLLMRVGGEMLERANLPRDPRFLSKERVKEIERTVRGNAKAFIR